MAEINNFVQVIIRLQTGGASKTGFGTTLIAAPHTLFTARIQFFTDLNSLEDLKADALHGTINGIVYNMAQTAFSQNPRPSRVAIGRIQVDEVLISIETVVDGQDYSVTLDGIDYTYTAIVTDTTTDLIATGLAGVLTAVSGFTSVGVGASSGDLTLIVDTPGQAFSFTVLSSGDDILASPNPGGVEAWTTGLAAIQNASDDWYGLTVSTRDKADQEPIADWVEANGSVKFFRLASNDTVIANTAVGADVTSIAALLKAKSYDRSSVIYHTKADGTLLDEWIDVAWSVMSLSFDPDVETATDKFKVLRAITPDAITATQRAIIIGTEESPTSGKNANLYSTVAGENITQSGMTASGEWNDIILGADWLRVRIEERIFAAYIKNPKIPFTNAGIQALVSEIRAQLQLGINTGFLAFDSDLDETFGFAVEAPTISEVPSADRANRILKGLKFFATAAGAIHGSKPIIGTLAP